MKPQPPLPVAVLVLAALLVLLLVVVQFGVISVTFAQLGLSQRGAVILLAASLFGSFINIPLFSLKTAQVPTEIDLIIDRLLGLRPRSGLARMIVAVNLGGCVIPIIFSAYLLHMTPLPVADLVVAIGVVTLVSYGFSRPVEHMGVMMPILIAPLTAALVSLLLNPLLASPLAYVCGTLGVLIGADLLRIQDVRQLNAPLASIGGAGLFDGVYLTGIIAVLLTG